jgi:hypothetical protein
MPTDLNKVRWQLFSGLKQNDKMSKHFETWLVGNWPDYVERSFARAPKDSLEELRKIVADKSTPEVEAGTKRGGKVSAIPARPLGDLEFATLSDLLKEYEKKLEAMGVPPPLRQAFEKVTQKSKEAVHDPEDFDSRTNEAIPDLRWRITKKRKLTGADLKVPLASAHACQRQQVSSSLAEKKSTNQASQKLQAPQPKRRKMIQQVRQRMNDAIATLDATVHTLKHIKLPDHFIEAFNTVVDLMDDRQRIEVIEGGLCTSPKSEECQALKSKCMVLGNILKEFLTFALNKHNHFEKILSGIFNGDVDPSGFSDEPLFKDLPTLEVEFEYCCWFMRALSLMAMLLPDDGPQFVEIMCRVGIIYDAMMLCSNPYGENEDDHIATLRSWAALCAREKFIQRGNSQLVGSFAFLGPVLDKLRGLTLSRNVTNFVRQVVNAGKATPLFLNALADIETLPPELKDICGSQTALRSQG